jgi:hypothetical protein
MWLFEQHGFVSVVAYDPSKDRNSKSQFRKIARQKGTHLLVRSRIKADLDMLKTVVPSLVVETDAGADYAYRAVVTRKQFKQFLAKSVDNLQYDSHFKEAARDNSPKVKDRYSTYMSVWSAMSRLQDVAPWSGGYGGYGGLWGDDYGYGSGTKSTGYVSPYGSDAKKSSGSANKSKAGAESMEAFLDQWNEVGSNLSFSRGEGPKTGFKEGDKVQGYFGTGVVTKVDVRDGDVSDMVTVTPDDPKVKTSGKYLSNYLFPADLPEKDLDAEFEQILALGAASQHEDERVLDLDWMSQWVCDNKDLKKFPATRLSELDDDAFELITRLGERFDEDSASWVVPIDVLSAVELEIMWERAVKENDQVEINRMIADGLVPEKYVNEALRFWADDEQEVES